MNRRLFAPAASVFAAAALVMTLLPAPAGAECALGAANDDVDTAVRSFGWMVVAEDTLLARAGNSFLLDCDAHLETIAATIMLPGYVSYGIDPLVAGDLVRCDLYDGAKNLIATLVQSIPETGFQPVLLYDFSYLPFRLAAGTLYFMLTPVERRWAYMRLGSEYADGDYQQDFYGSWGQQANDAKFNIVWDPASELVATEASSWGVLKALYR